MIRVESDRDVAAARAVLTAAFPSPVEAMLVGDLRAAQDLVLGLVAGEEGIVGYVAFSRLGAPQADLRATALAPLAVRPECQRKGIGSALVRDGLSRLSEAGEDLVLVVGEATFYERCGFSREAAAGLSTPYDGLHLLAKALSARGSQARGPVCYAPAFAKLG